jgi:hypothetical protein
MNSIEQAIYTSAATGRATGYHIVARSPGLHDEDARELTIWCPSHDSFMDSVPEAMSYNFHPLPSGSYCISRTVPAGWEYSGRGGVRVYTHCLIVPAETLLKFSNNPFSLLKAALASGTMDIRDPLPAQLEPIVLAGGSTTVDQNLLVELAGHPGPHAVAALLQGARDSICLAVGGAAGAEKLIAGILNCLPLTHRPEFSFSTGLKFSPRRQFRLVALPSDPAERRWLEHHDNVLSIDVSEDLSAKFCTLDGWSKFIEKMLSTGRTAFFSTQVSKRRNNLMPDDLPVLGLQLLEELDATDLQNSCIPQEKRSETASPQASAGELPPPSDAPNAEKIAAFIQHAHAAHGHFAKSAADAKSAYAAPSHTVGLETPAALQKLELLDDWVYEAIGGNAQAMQQLHTLWPTLKTELDERALSESREQYLRYALSIWEDYVDKDGHRDPVRAVNALDVLCLLFEGE